MSLEEEMLKKCSSCEGYKAPQEFSRSHKSKCRDCLNESKRLSRSLNPENGIKARLKYYYQLTLEDYEILLDRQEGRCAVCRKPPSCGKRLVVDHDHSCCPTDVTCGKCIRGLLCHDCNRGLGSFKDSLLHLSEAINYLKECSSDIG